MAFQLKTTLGVVASAALAATVAQAADRSWSYEEMISCAGALRVRPTLPGLTPQQQTDYFHDSLYYGPRLGKVIPQSKQATWTQDWDRASQLWAEAAKSGAVGRKAVEDRAERCRAASDTTALPSSIGAASMSGDGAITLRLASSTPNGIAHMIKAYRPADGDYRAVLAHLGGLSPGGEKPVPPWP